jgi:thiol:disulfide interchange protein DsbA
MNRLTRLAMLILCVASALTACAAPDDASRASTSSTTSAAVPATARPDVIEGGAVRADAPPETSPSSSGVEDNLRPGQDYVDIAGGRPYADENGKVEVVEVFGYVCPACARFHPLVGDWSKALPADVAFRYVPAPFGRDWDPYARGFYVAEALGMVPRTHDALINAIHAQHSMPGEGQGPTDEAVAKFYARFGANEQDFLSQMKSFATETKLRRGRQFIIRSGVEGTPTLIVAGRYRVLGKTWQDSLRVADQLIARERRHPTGLPGQ